MRMGRLIKWASVSALLLASLGFCYVRVANAFAEYQMSLIMQRQHNRTLPQVPKPPAVVPPCGEEPQAQPQPNPEQDDDYCDHIDCENRRLIRI